ncbi:MAG: hypothetical protein ACTSVI_11590 [Promethearchaeota archaeon]
MRRVIISDFCREVLELESSTISSNYREIVPTTACNLNQNLAVIMGSERIMQ